jgi:hypothetical protein
MRTFIGVVIALVAVAPSLFSNEQRREPREVREAEKAAKAAKAAKESHRCYGIRVEAADSEIGSFRRRGRTTRFSAREVRDLRVEVFVPEATATEPLSVKLYTPRGRLYQVLQVAASAPDDLAGKRGGRRSAGRSYGVLSAQFPVAGTQITSFDMFGNWRVEAHLDGSEGPCTRPFEFELER